MIWSSAKLFIYLLLHLVFSCTVIIQIPLTLAIAIFSMALNHTISFSTYFYDKKIRYKMNHYHVSIIIISIFIIIWHLICCIIFHLKLFVHIFFIIIRTYSKLIWRLTVYEILLWTLKFCNNYSRIPWTSISSNNLHLLTSHIFFFNFV
jgi:hypothetical protein